MVVLVSYDVNTQDAAGKRRLRRIARLCTSWGQRVQFSVFECLLDNAQWQVLRAQLLDEMDPERDSLRFYFLGNHWRQDRAYRRQGSLRSGRSADILIEDLYGASFPGRISMPVIY